MFTQNPEITMTKKEFLNSIFNRKEDIIKKLLNILRKLKINYCVIGGLAVNAYVEPVVSLDLDIVIVTSSIDEFIKNSIKHFKIKKFPHSYNLNSKNSDLRIQLQLDNRYQSFIQNSILKKVLGYTMKVANIRDILKGKIWAFSDSKRRPSKRQKDLADIIRIIEKYPHLKKSLPKSIKNIINKM